MNENSLHRVLLETSSFCPEYCQAGQKLIHLKDVCNVAFNQNMSVRNVEIAALENSIIPIRYIKNMGLLGVSGQIKLLKSSVAIVGAGGLGGYVIELLSRMGVGKLIIIDYDSIDESNLNRQLLALENNLDRAKVDAAVERIDEINSAVEVQTFKSKGQRSNLKQMLPGCSLVVDCLDNLTSRFDLEESCAELGLIMVHGAIAGFLGQMAVIYPDRPLLAAIYGYRNEMKNERGVEAQLGNPAFTPAMLAAWQAGEVVKILAELSGAEENDKLTIIDMFSGDTHRIKLSEEK